MMNAMIFAGIFLLMLGFVAGGEAVCDWYWQRRRRKKKEKEILFCLQHGISASDLRAMKRYLTDLEKEVRTR